MRKLATASFSFTGALFISRFILPYDWLLLAAAIAALCSIIGLFFKNYARVRIVIVSLSIAIGLVWSFVFTSQFNDASELFHEQTKTVEATITDFPVERRRGYRVDVAVNYADSPTVNARLYFNQEIELTPGDSIRFTARFRRADETVDGERIDFLTARGIFLSAFVSGNITMIESDSSLKYLPRLFSGQIARQTDEIFAQDVSPFMQALLAGHREQLNRDTSLSSALTGSGIIHIVSISGMHVAFLMGFLGILIKDRRLFALWGIPVLFLFMAMTGFTPAVTRAGIMQAALISAPLFRRESDSITSLSAALLLILLLNPFAIASVGLQLSFTATLGILLFSSKINNALIKPIRRTRLYKNQIIKHVINYAISGFATTIGALLFTMPLTAIHFGYVSLISPLTNFLTLWAVSIAFPLGLVANLLAFIHNHIAIIIVYPVTLLVRYIIFVARTMASVPYSMIYSSNAPLMLWLGYVYVLFIALPLIKARVRQYLIPICTALVLLFASLLIMPVVSDSNEASITVLDVGQGLSAAITLSDHTILIDCGSLSGENAGAIAHEYLANRGRTLIDFLIITHYHDDHVNGIEYLISRMSIGALVIPDPEGSFLGEEIIDIARRSQIEILYVTQTLTMTLEDTTLIIYPPLGEGGENERGLAILALGDITALFTGDMNSTTERTLLRFAQIPELDLLVVGHHGSRHSTSEELLEATRPTIAVIPVGRNNFGHPADEVTNRLNRFEVIVYRTDKDGNVTVGAAK